MLREKFHEEIVYQWFLMILSGKNPRIVKDARYTETNGLKVEEDTTNMTAPSPERQDQAMAALLNRRDGLPAQRVQLESELKMFSVNATVDATALAGLPAEKLAAIAATLRAALSMPSPTLALDESDDEDDELVDGPPEDARDATPA